MTPLTPTGRKLFTDIDPMDMLESTVTPDDICAVEREVAVIVFDIVAKAVPEMLAEMLRSMHADG